MVNWRSVNIEGFNHYVVSENGEVINTKTLRLVKVWKNEQGYSRVTLSGNKRQNFYVHRLVAITFLDCPGDDYEVNHKNKIRSDNNVNNLEWLTRAENIYLVHHDKHEGFEQVDDLPF